MFERLQYYRAWNTGWPNHILFYWDGVSESQYGMVVTKELQQIKDAIDDIKKTAPGQSINTKVTLVVVGKRHHARFYPLKSPADNWNLNPGLVVDTDVVLARTFNFYLQSHDSPLGTARSGHYVVLANESGYTADDLQKAVCLPSPQTCVANAIQTNRLCSMSARATQCLSICTAARYADLLCDRLRLYMKPLYDKKIDADDTTNSLSNYRNNANIWGTRLIRPF